MKWLLLLAACGQGDPCDGVAGTCVTLHVTSPDVARIDTLDVDLLAGSFHATATTSGDASPPLETAIELALTGELDLGIVAAGRLADDLVGTGFARLTVGDGAHIDAHLALVAPQACVEDTLYCGGNLVAGSSDTLYACKAGAPIARGVCPGGCAIRPNKGDLCTGAGGACVTGGLYCGGDKLDGDPQSLYKCGTGLVMACANGCVIGSAGHDDACR